MQRAKLGGGLHITNFQTDIPGVTNMPTFKVEWEIDKMKANMSDFCPALVTLWIQMRTSAYRQRQLLNTQYNNVC